MLNFCYAFHDLQQYRNSLLGFLNIADTGDTIYYPPGIAKGFSIFRQLQQGISFQIVNYTATTDILFDRRAERDDGLLIVFKNINAVINDAVLPSSNLPGSVQVSTTGQPEQILLPAGKSIRALKVYISKKNLSLFLRNDHLFSLFSDYIDSSENRNNQRRLSVEQCQWFNEVTGTAPCNALEEWQVNGRVYLLLESFISSVFTRQPGTTAQVDEQYRLVRIGEYLKSHYHEAFPGIQWLCRYACLSRTRLLNLFKKLYGITPGEFHQRNRLRIAHDLLASGVYTISEIATLLEYKNFSNFTSSFKKEFGYLPSCLIPCRKTDESL